MTTLLQSELLGLTLQELTSLAESLGEPGFRARQLFDALYRQRLTALEDITTLPKSLRSRLVSLGYRTGFPTIDQRFVSADGTVRYLVRFSDGQTVETVWMPEGDGVEDTEELLPGSAVEDSRLSSNAQNRRGTICLSSQSGCAVNCKFCMTALLGLQRNLSAGEILGQVLLVLNDHGMEIGRDRINLVFMGQGEPFLNYENFIRAVRLLVAGVGISESRMTVSTSGIVQRIADFGREQVRPHLAISLNGSNDEVRERVMPINRKWNLASILEVARGFPLRSRERLTFEYVLLSGVNDTPENAREVVALLREIRAKVNLIALNPGPEIPFQTPAASAVEAFQQILVAAGIPAYVRRPRGLDIYAACGQLKRTNGLTSIT
ncbi:MAG TPA: 23S rRNA (adenine(2503)-C(2))-methyltransferase RlmN [Candidatus Saccharimonadales bacterium]|nr:23S rRNA (adenine(2503)-C(2))-methyltransferase RlmN [Candidatus Saccharimonadales bacterium]